MCGRLVNLDTVARVLADYYHLKTDTQLAALNEALSRVPAETVGKELFGNSEQLEKDHVADPGNMVGDLIGRQTAMRAVNGLIDRFERILRDIRETQVDDSVCGMCEYDGAFVGQSGNWCNECPGFEKDDCFKLSDECRKRWLKEAIDGVEK